MESYPQVLSEEATLAAVLEGRSLARYGDGEFKLCAGGTGIKSQVGHPELAVRLRRILQRPPAGCLVGIPNIYSRTPKAAFWAKYTQAARFLAPDVAYASAFVSRPDSAPWIDTDAYWQQLEALWVGQRVTLVRGSGKSLTAEDLLGATEVVEIVGPRQHAWADYRALLERIGRPARVLLCLGPTATVMAADLCAQGVQAVDLGHVGMFLRKRRRGEPLWVTDEDRGQ